jgi:uncharacterized protein
LMGIEHAFNFPVLVWYPVRVVATAIVLGVVSRRVVSFRAVAPVLSIGIGIAVFVIWIAPDALFGYRHHWLFGNAITGRPESSTSAAAQSSRLFVAWHLLGSSLVVPVVEELFWRAWLMRWLIQSDFEKVALGTYAPMAFWVTAVMFASEHGSYWEVGLAAGIIYNWWMIRTKSLADCVLAHGVTNAVLSIYVLATAQWQYWP